MFTEATNLFNDFICLTVNFIRPNPNPDYDDLKYSQQSHLVNEGKVINTEKVNNFLHCVDETWSKCEITRLDYELPLKYSA